MMSLLKKLMLSVVIFMSFSSIQAYQALIFDCDGVLVDTEHLKFLAWQKALASEQIKLTDKDYYPWVGQTSATICEGLRLQKKANFSCDNIISLKNKIYTNLQKQGVPQFANAVNFMKVALAKKAKWHIKIAIASSAEHAEILENLKQLGISAHELDAILSGHDDLKHIHDPQGTNKPKPYIYQLVTQKLAVAPQSCLVFEDSGAGVEAAAKAAMKVIAIPNDYTRSHDFSLAYRIAQFKPIENSALKDAPNLLLEQAIE